MSAKVSLVIPGRDVAATIGPCLEAVFALPEPHRPAEVILVDDGSVDETAGLAAAFGVRIIKSKGEGPAVARNLGWRAATHPLVWFIDADCVPEPDALAKLLPHLQDAAVAGVGGSYGNLCPGSLLACLIHEEIVERHRAMPAAVNFLGSFNVLYRRSILEQTGGFDERIPAPACEDAELAFRIREAGHELRFDQRSRVGHFHPTHLGRYLRTQKRHGFWRVWLYAQHPGRAGGDSYSGLVDHAQPVLAMLAMASAPLLLVTPVRWAPFAVMACLLAAQAPMTWRLVRRTGQTRFVGFAGMSLVRAFWRGLGMAQGVVQTLVPRRFVRA